MLDVGVVGPASYSDSANFLCLIESAFMKITEQESAVGIEIIWSELTRLLEIAGCPGEVTVVESGPALADQ